ncbi:heavy metal translocating P-type ATPase [Reichenbachiella agariperforans]|uniref:heavy metal translocating P-type ATPase n=1 Tax=Reichenbachiella agariperforans TaxID=156994 RepID=UPI001C09A42F|nr:heavy metal translocating P-type ATPase metal-binding domain-containing protein [Reichenbachiella agariperforans]MBU2913122.1 heavy metal translocating P-type ATPase metal-binding domain-containing protein [Reichenbachiella agariperforans]
MQLTVEQTCYHCGEDCDNASYELEDKHFCCLGCQTVYQLLEENDLCTYYDLERAPGNQLKSFYANKYGYLDNQEIADRLLDFKSEDYHKITLNIPSIHCSSCIWLLENLTRFDAGIIQSRINFSQKKLTIDYTPHKTQLPIIIERLCQLGYEPEITLDTQQQGTETSSNKDTFVKLGISGFTFGNIMLFSFPEYFGLHISSEFVQYFGYLNLLLSIPVLVYCAQEFFSSAFRGVAKKVLNIDLPIAMGILAIFIRSSYEILSQTGAGYFDSMAALVFLLLIGRWFQGQTYRNLSFDRNYKSYFPLAVTLINQQEKKSVLVETLQAGDKIEIRNEEIIPCDAILVSPSAQIDYSFVTGETKSIAIREGEKIYAGGRIKGVAVKMNVLHPVSQSYLTQLWNNEVFAKENPDEEHLIINRVSRYFTPTILGLATLAGLVWLVIDSSQAMNVFSSVLIIACPCALALATPFTLGSVLNVLARHQFYLKGTEVIERIWQTKHIIFDKTGTITNHQDHTINYHGMALTAYDEQLIASLTKHSTHPLSQAICAMYSTVTAVPVTQFEEVKGQGLKGQLDGHLLQIGSASLTLAPHTTIQQTQVHINIDGVYRGFFSFENQYRKGLKNLINQLKAHYQFSILSGDNDAERTKLSEIFPPDTAFYFSHSPVDKLEKIKNLEATQSTIMIGDGLNDAGALKASSVGLSVSDNMSSFSPASDGILLGKRLVDLDSFLRLITQSRMVIIIGFVISFAYNIVGLSFAVAGMITPVFAALLMPISSISVVAFTTLTIRWLGRRIS